MPKPLLHNDAGLQPERTSLAWQRTIFAFATLAAFSVKLLSADFAVFYCLFLALVSGCVLFASRRERHYAKHCKSLVQEAGGMHTQGILLTSLTLTMTALVVLLEVLLRAPVSGG